MDDLYIKRDLPHNREAEQAVLGAMLMDRDAILIASEILVKEDFYDTTNSIIFEAIVEIHNQDRPVDLITLQNCLRGKQVSEEISNLEYAKELVVAVETSANVKYYAEIVSEKSTLRRLIHLSKKIENMSYLQKEPLDEIVEKIEKHVFQVAQKKNVETFVPIKQVVVETLDEIEQASKVRGRVTGIPTGFIDLDEKMAGLQNSDLILIGARPAMGKTAFVLNIAQHVAFKEGKTVAIFSLEMSKKQLVKRLFALEGMIDSQALRVGDLKETDWERLVETAGIIGRSNLIIDDTGSISVKDLCSKCRKYKLEKGLDLIIIDYLQLMSGSQRNKNTSREQEVGEISRALKGLAKELDIPIIALSQINREADKRQDHKPITADLRESGNIEQDADIIMFIYRDEVYNKDTEKKNVAEIIIAKQRNGTTGSVDLTWLPQYTKFANYMKDENK